MRCPGAVSRVGRCLAAEYAARSTDRAIAAHSRRRREVADMADANAGELSKRGVASMAYRGPYLVLTLDEVTRVVQALAGEDDALARSVLDKCSSVATSSPKFRSPSR